MDKMYEIAIIGGGPGGVGAAVESVMLGFEKIILIEKGIIIPKQLENTIKIISVLTKIGKGKLLSFWAKLSLSTGQKKVLSIFLIN